jgi:hypothetical protein
MRSYPPHVAVILSERSESKDLLLLFLSFFHCSCFSRLFLQILGAPGLDFQTWDTTALNLPEKHRKIALIPRSKNKDDGARPLYRGNHFPAAGVQESSIPNDWTEEAHDAP